MYHSIIVSLIAGETIRRRRRENAAPDAVSRHLSRLNDYQLRDIGYVRERTVAPSRHLIWM